MKNKKKYKNTFLPPFPSSQAQLHSRFFYLLLLSSTGAWGIGVTASS